MSTRTSASASPGCMSFATPDIPLELFAQNRRRLIAQVKDSNKKALIFLQGGDLIPVYNSDTCYPFRQESYFMWAFGVTEPGFYGAINVETQEVYLFMPRIDEKNLPLTVLLYPNQIKSKYMVDRVHYVDEMVSVLKALKPSKLLVLSGSNSETEISISMPNFDGKKNFVLESTTLIREMTKLRVYKSVKEQDIIEYANRITVAALFEVLSTARSGIAEYYFESVFKKHCYSEDSCNIATLICCSGPNSSIVHCGYQGAMNMRTIEDGEMCMLDATAQYFGYYSDLTMSFPVNGKFSIDQKTIYDIVLNAYQKAVDACKPSISWANIHILATRTLLMGLKEAKILNGGLEEMFNAGMAEIFQPHGVGHLLGLDVYDVGGYMKDTPPKPKERYLRVLRSNRVLEEGMCIAIESGCYFLEEVLDEASHEISQYFNMDLINKYRVIGGVRIEDNFIISDTGCRSLTAWPKTTHEIEECMAV